MDMKVLLIPFFILVASFSLVAQTADVYLPALGETHVLPVNEQGEVLLTVRGLAVGKDYEISVVQDKAVPRAAFGATTTGEVSGNTLRRTATAVAETVCLDVLLPGVRELSVYLRPGHSLRPGEKLMDVVRVEESNDADYMLNTIFRQDSCFELNVPPDALQTVWRPRSVMDGGGHFSQTGVFRDGLASVGIDSGLIISTGYVSNAPGPNAPNASADTWINLFDPPITDDEDANGLRPNAMIYDIASMEFEFIPTTDTVTFNYVFFSEQYCQTLNSEVAADAFGFILTRPDGTTENIARLPISNDVVSPFTLNPGSPDEAFFVSNTAPGHVATCGPDAAPLPQYNGIAYDGFSRVLQAKGAVIPCGVHTLRIIVLDTRDGFVDSGVLLEAGSFLAGLVNKPEPNTTAEITGLNPVEGCDTAFITFTRRTTDEPFINRPLPVKYNVIPYFGPGNEATRGFTDTDAGADYVLPASPFIIPAGDTSGTLTIPILGDNNFGEGLEGFIVRYDGTCDCTENADTFLIQDAVNFDVALGPDVTACANTVIDLRPDIMGGNGSYTYEWSDGSTADTLRYVATGQDSTLFVTLTDDCGLTGSDTITIGSPDITANVDSFYSLCLNPVAEVLVDVEGASNYRIVLEVDSGGVTTQTPYLIGGDTTFTFTQTANIRVLSVEDANGCGGATIGTAFVRSNEVDLTAAIVQPVCPGDLGSIAITTAEGNLDYIFRWEDDPSAISATRTQLSPGEYVALISPLVDPDCTDRDTFRILAPAPLSLDSLTFAPVTCAGEMTTLTPHVSGGTPPYAFSWTPGSSTDSLLSITTVEGDTTYEVTISDDCGTVLTGSVTLDFPTVQANLDGRYSLCDQSSVSVPLEITGPAGSYAVDLTIDSAGVIVNRTLTLAAGANLLPFDYAATLTLTAVRTTTGCSGRLMNVTATVVDPQLAFNAAVTNIDCNGNQIGRIDVSGVRNVPVTFTWGDIGSGPALRENLPAGDYALTITDQEDTSCAIDTVITIREPDTLRLTIINEPASCALDTINLIPQITGGTPPYTYDWDNGQGGDSLYQIVTAGGMTGYPLTVTDACGDSVSNRLFLTFFDNRAAVSGFYSVCNPPFSTQVPVTLSGNGPFTFVIDENGTQRTLTATGDTSLTYTAATDVQLISVTGSNGCAGVAGGIANVTDGTFDVVADLTNVSCRTGNDGRIVLDVNEGNSNVYDYTWSVAGLDGPDVTGLTAGTYDVTITDRTAAACSFDTSFTIIEPITALSVVQDSVRDVTCRGEGYAGAAYNGGTGQITYAWSTGDSIPFLDNLAAGLYELTVTDANGCTVVNPFNVQDRRREVLASIAASAPELSCDLTSVQLSAQQNTFPTDYRWRNAAGGELGIARQLTVSAPGWYFVEITDPATGCTGLDSLEVRQSNEVLDLDLPATYALTCVVSSVDPTVTVLDFGGAVTYAWRLVGSGAVGTTAGLTGIDTPGDYEVTVTRTDNGCSSTATTSVVITRDDPVVTVPQPIIGSNCRMPEVNIAVSAEGPNSFGWSTADGSIVESANDALIRVDEPGLYTVLVTDTITGCTATAEVRVVQDGVTLVADAGTDQPLVCDGTGTALNASFAPALNGTRVVWYAPDGAEITTNLQAFTFSEGPHVLEVIHPESGCSSFDTVNVISEAPTAVTYVLQQPPCPEVGGRLYVTGVTGRNGPFEFSSPTGQTEPFSDGLRGLPEGTNVLVVTDQFGCELRDSFLIFDTGFFEGTAPDVVVSLGEEATLGVETNRPAGGIASYTWRNLPDSLACATCPAPATAPLESFVAEVLLVDTNGCSLTLQQQVIVEEPDLLYLPTAFSPGNQDGVNDIYTVFGNADFVTSVELFHIYDRWGNRVYTQENFAVNDPNLGWDGTSPDGQRSPPAVYVYVIEYLRWDNERVVVKGDFVLLR